MERDDIFRTTRPLEITRYFVYRTVTFFEDTGGIIDRKPLREQKILTRNTNTPTQSISRIRKYDLGIRAFKTHNGHLLTVALKKQRRRKSKTLRRHHAKNAHIRILFTEEKISSKRNRSNKRTIKVYALSSRQAAGLVPRVHRGHHPASVMDRVRSPTTAPSEYTTGCDGLVGVAYDGVTKLNFFEKEVKTSAKLYQSEVLKLVVLF